MKEIIIDLMNTEAVRSAVYAIAAYLLSVAIAKLYAKKPEWKQYEGTIIAAIKHAEKLIPDDTPNKSLERLDVALRYVIRLTEEGGVKLTSKQIANIKDGISLKHHEIENGVAL